MKATKRNKMKTECAVSGYLALALQVAKYLGLAPIRIEKIGKSRRISISLTYHVIGCVAVTVSGVLQLWVLLSDGHYRRTNSNKCPIMQSATWVLQVVTMILTCTLLTYTASRQMRCVIDVMNQLQKISIMLYIPNLTLSWKKKEIPAFVTGGIFCVTLVLYDYWSFVQFLEFTEKDNFLKITLWKIIYFIYYACYWVIQLDEIIFILLVLHIRFIFQAVNNSLNNLLKVIEQQQRQSETINPSRYPTYKILQKLNNYAEAAEDCKSSFSGEMTKEFPHETIHRLALAYSRACETVRAVDSFYGLRLVVVFALNFMYLITTPYFFVNNLKDVDEAQIKSIGVFFWIGISTCFWCVSHLLNLGMLIEPCHLTHAEMKKTREVVSRMIGYTHSTFDPLPVQLQRFSRQLLLNDVSFRPLNVFTMSRGLLLKVLGSVTTYLVILIDIKY